MGRRRGRGVVSDKPQHIKKEAEIVVFKEIKNPKIHMHVTSSQVLSLWDKEEPLQEMIIDDAININLFVRGR